ncbi:30S ribosomal protein S8 [Candidatus Shapirobacteria bacterium CG10_big_fil_rev_8_21_14_0_10_38_14]|uniref:Small ribosomal subunit protein uS8 n=1 Tax=Candidatus Shapirobacteria bacterium CG10_big_fil_rev_8_21_14_0_10_38_14 TaxID=1974483 RepID=A0A2M8L5N9_9BACT|nr:MAG: 30S ribosomal protein S8 [Candidatus Shapirobacteria bacterium CG10_big_fil_rev_8_21_14_0_10_38_14]
MTDLIADMLTRIRNGYLARKKQVAVPYSKIKEAIAKIMVKKGYLEKFERRETKDERRSLELTLKYDGKDPTITEIRRVSKPSVKVYQKAKQLRSVNADLGIKIVSTSAGLMTGKEAKKKNLGGEVICEMW